MGPGKGKQKGSAFERKVARILSTWMFEDENILWRDSTSGGRKAIYNGDIVPANAHSFPWGTWPFMFELKTGYPNYIPTLMNQNKVREWISKLMSELTEIQCIPMLITQFLSQNPILITPLILDFYCDIMLIHPYNEQYYSFYIYDFNKLIKTRFCEVMPADVLQYIYKATTNKIEKFVQELPEEYKPIEEPIVDSTPKNTKKKAKKADDDFDALKEIFGNEL